MTELANYLTERLPTTEDRDNLVLTSADLEELWGTLVSDTYEGRRGLETFLLAVQAQAGDSEQADLEFRPGGWQVNLRVAAVKSIVSTALIGGLLVAIGATAIPAALIGTVVPMLFDITKVQLTPGQEYLLAELVGRKEALDGTLTARQLYDQLPPDTRAQLSLMDFADFLDACRRAGLADTSDDGSVTLRTADHARFRITWR